ncbi:MAG: HAD hydrolase-like protein [Desulfobacteraceae bacterium]|nr:MAG: HAD hydrolase-like protein [Desulfobacteraceae bacterium]
MKSKPLIVFDMDGVIIDVSRSYRDTIRQSARLFLKGAQSWENLPDPLFQLSDLARVKQGGGLNNDWDLTFLVIDLLFPLAKKPAIREFGTPTSPSAPDSADRPCPKLAAGKSKGLGGGEDPDNWSIYEKVIRGCDVTELARFLRSTKKPLTTLLEKKEKPNDEFIMSLCVGDVGSGNIIKQIFQEIYLGKDLFKSTYGIDAKVYYGEGYANKEKPLVDKSILESLLKNNFLAIATGRPKTEADYPLDSFGLRKYFSIILTLDDCIREEKRMLEQEGNNVSLSKPNPFMLDAIAETKKNEASGFYYVGDMPDDMVAASRSKTGFTGVGVLFSATDKVTLKRDLLRAGADYVIRDFNELERIIESNE